jgi:pSer/pThr/pTyr-binding forkhead associated (FHA) protein
VRVILEIVSGPSAGKEFEVLDGQVIRVGCRRPAEFLLLDDPWMFDIHFALECTNEQCRLRNLNSRTWTTLNGEKVTEAAVRNGDKIVAGGTRFVVHMANRVGASVGAAVAPAATERPAPPAAAILPHDTSTL